MVISPPPTREAVIVGKRSPLRKRISTPLASLLEGGLPFYTKHSLFYCPFSARTAAHELNVHKAGSHPFERDEAAIFSAFFPAASFASCLAASVAATVMAAEARTMSFRRNWPIRVRMGKPVTAGAITKMVSVP